MKLIKTYGILKFNQFGYNPKNCTTKPSSYALQNAKANTIEGYQRLSKYGDQSSSFVRKVKKAIAEKNPVVIGMTIHRSFYRAKGVWSPQQYNDPSQQQQEEEVATSDTSNSTAPTTTFATSITRRRIG